MRKKYVYLTYVMSMCKNRRDGDQTGTRWPESHPFWLQLKAQYFQSTASWFSEINYKSVVPVPESTIIQDCKLVCRA